MRTYIALITSIVTVSLFNGCTESSSPFDYKKEVVVTGLIEAGRPIDSLRLVYTGDPALFYDPDTYAIRNATVVVTGIDVAFNDTLVHDATRPGRYYSIHPGNIIQPLKSYALRIVTAEGSVLTASTTVPDTFSITYCSLKDGAVVPYNPLAPVNSFEWTPSRSFGTYLPTVSSLDSNAARIQRSFIRDTTSFPAPDKIGYRVGLPKEQTNTELPWIFLSYYGTTRFDVFAVDENYNRFLNQFFAAQGGELKEIHYNVNGGLGFFGSRTRAQGSITIYLTPLAP